MGRLRTFARGTLLGRLLLVPYRFLVAMRVALVPAGHALRWTFASREHYNYTYDLKPRNLEHLAAFVAAVSGRSQADAKSYLDELANDHTLKAHIQHLTAQARERHVADREVRFGRRLGWYALVRATRPRLVVETGVDKGLGSVVLAAALRRNAAEGAPGRLVAIDIDPRAGYLLTPPYTEAGQLLIQDSRLALRSLTDPVDLFIHDSDHNPEFEAEEYQAVAPHLAPDALILSDNSAHTDELLKFAAATGRRFLYFAEQPLRHWWPGEGIGVAYHQD